MNNSTKPFLLHTLHPTLTYSLPSQKGKVKRKVDISFVWPSHTGAMWQDNVVGIWLGGKDVRGTQELPVGPLVLPAGGERSALVPWRHSNLGTSFAHSLKFQLVAGSPLPVLKLWGKTPTSCPWGPNGSVTTCPRSGKNISTYGDKETAIQIQICSKTCHTLTTWQVEHDMHVLWTYSSLPLCLSPLFSLYLSSHLRTQNRRHLGLLHLYSFT
jgi:hypothetical protein